jgi:hypothetical protein
MAEKAEETSAPKFAVSAASPDFGFLEVPFGKFPKM